MALHRVHCRYELYASSADAASAWVDKLREFALSPSAPNSADDALGRPSPSPSVSGEGRSRRDSERSARFRESVADGGQGGQADEMVGTSRSLSFFGATHVGMLQKKGAGRYPTAIGTERRAWPRPVPQQSCAAAEPQRLNPCGHRYDPWRQRWFALLPDGTLRYYDRAPELRVAGSCAVHLPSTSHLLLHEGRRMLTWTAHGRTATAIAESAEVLEAWAAACAAAAISFEWVGHHDTRASAPAADAPAATAATATATTAMATAPLEHLGAPEAADGAAWYPERVAEGERLAEEERLAMIAMIAETDEQHI
jgi:hypothetical protein